MYLIVRTSERARVPVQKDINVSHKHGKVTRPYRVHIVALISNIRLICKFLLPDYKD